MIATSTQIKSILGITDSTYDTRITTLMPMVFEDIIRLTNNQFLNHNFSFSGDITPTVAGGPVYSFDCADGGMDDEHFVAGDILYCDGSGRNDRYFTTTVIADTKITVTEQVYSEDEFSGKLILAVFPADLAIVYARMIGYQLDSAAKAGITHETILDYSVTRTENATGAGYPKEIMLSLARYTNVRCGFGTKRRQYNDYRGIWEGEEL